MDVVETPRVWLEAVNRDSLLAVLAFATAPFVRVVDGSIIICPLRCDRGAPPERRSSTCTRHVFALGLRQEAVSLAGFGVQPSDIALGIVIGHIDHGSPFASPAFIIRF